MPAWRHKCKICTSEWHRLVDMLRLEERFQKHVDEVDKLEAKIFKKEDALHLLKMQLAEKTGS